MQPMKYMPKLRHGIFLFIEKCLRWCINPRARARLLGLLGAQIGKNVRVYEIQLFSLANGFRHLHLADDVHVGPGCRIDLTGPLHIDKRSTLSPGVCVLTHADPGASHHSKLVNRYPPHSSGTQIGADCWIGANAVLLDGITVHSGTVVGAGAVVTSDLPSDTLAVGVPARANTNGPG